MTENLKSYGIRDIPGKGKGVVAIRDINPGELIICESPLIIYALVGQAYSISKVGIFSSLTKRPLFFLFYLLIYLFIYLFTYLFFIIIIIFYLFIFFIIIFYLFIYLFIFFF